MTGRLVELLRNNLHVRIPVILLATFMTIVALSLIQRPFEIECRGRLMPKQRSHVFSRVDGEVISIEVEESQKVDAAQIVARMRSRDIEKATIERTGTLNSRLKSRDAARADLLSRVNQPNRKQTAHDQAQLELVNSEIETIKKQLELLASERQQLELRAPISGTITTERPRDRLVGRPVHRGEPLLEVMNEAGEWQLELFVPERFVGHLLKYRQKKPGTNVRFRLLSIPQKLWDCQISRISDCTTTATDAGTGTLAYCDVSQIANKQVGSEVSAAIHCGSRSVLFIWFHEFIEILQRYWWL